MNAIYTGQLSKWWQSESCQDAIARAQNARRERIETMKREVAVGFANTQTVKPKQKENTTQ